MKKVILVGFTLLTMVALSGCGQKNIVSVEDSTLLKTSLLSSVKENKGPLATEENTPSPPEGCVTWFDGCNVCQVGELNGSMECTRKICSALEEEHCMKYKDE